LQRIDRKFVTLLTQSSSFLEYVDAVLLDERSSLNSDRIFNFLLAFFPKVSDQVLNEQMQTIIADLSKTFQENAPNLSLGRSVAVRQLNGDLRALLLVNAAKPDHLTPSLDKALRLLRGRVESAIETVAAEEGDADDEGSSPPQPAPSSSSASIPTSKRQKTMDQNAEDKARLSDALSLCLKTLKLLVEMCENKVKVQESAAALVANREREEAEEDDDDDEEEGDEEMERVNDTDKKDT